MKKEIMVGKNDGSLEAFNPLKLEKSLLRSGATRKIAQYVVNEVEKKLFDEISTKKIYTLAFQLFWKKSHYNAITYNLKKSILGLGPSGFNFEKFMAYVFQGKGFKTSLDNIKRGRCVKHEVDIIAKRDDFTVFSECKFHNSLSKKNDIKTALYVQARAVDLKESDKCEDFDEFWLISNTCFSKDAIKYAECVGLKLFGFNFPEQGTIGDIVKRYHLHPVTCLRKLKKYQIKKLLEKEIILCKQIYRDQSVLDSLNLSESAYKAVMKEIKMLVIK